jgi:hypothetical protein
MPLKVDLSRFKFFVREIARYRKKDEAEMLNKGLTTAIIGSSKYKGIVQLAPKATKERIRADLKEGDLNVRLAMAQLRKEGYFGTLHSRAEIQQKVAQICKARIKKRLKSRAYIAAGWIKSLQDLGILKSRTKGKRETNFWAGGSAAQGYGVRATPGRLRASAFSMARGSEKVLGTLLQTAVNNACEDMKDYFRNKIAARVAQIARAGG